MNLGLRAKLTGSIAFSMLLLAAAVVVYFPWRQEDIAASALETRAEDIASALSAALAPDLRLPGNNIDDRLQTFATQKRDAADAVGYINIIDRSGEILHKWSDDAIAGDDINIDSLASEISLMAEYRGDYLHLSVAIPRDSGDRMATLNLAISRQSIEDAKWSSRINSLVLGVLILLIGMAVAWFMGGTLTTPILEVVKELEEVSTELAAAARDQEASSAEEAAAVAETRRAMETLLQSAQQIADRSSEVLGNAERSTSGAQHIVSRIGNLNVLSERIAEILGSIMQVADKADLLALNASLEGTRAGEAGKGFALVGAEMRRLAENVIESVSGIRELMKEMRELSQAAVSASREGNTSSTATRISAQEIAMLTQDQRKATEQVIASMDELGSILNLTLDGIQRTSGSAGHLTQLARDLSQVVKPEFEMEDEAEDMVGTETTA